MLCLLVQESTLPPVGVRASLRARESLQINNIICILVEFLSISCSFLPVDHSRECDQIPQVPLLCVWMGIKVKVEEREREREGGGEREEGGREREREGGREGEKGKEKK